MMEKRCAFSLGDLPRRSPFPLKLSSIGWLPDNFYPTRKVVQKSIIVSFVLKCGERHFSFRDGKRRKTNPPEVSFCRPGTLTWTETDSPWDELYFSYSAGDAPLLKSMGFDLELYAERTLPVADLSLLERQIETIADLCSKIHLPGTVDLLDAAVAWTLFSAIVPRSESIPGDASSQAPAVRTAAALIRREFRGRVNLNPVLREFGMSESTFYRRWRESFGMPVHAFLLEQRIRFSEQLLRTTEYTLKEIADDCGFADQTEFCRHFKRRRNMTPGEYRRTISPEKSFE